MFGVLFATSIIVAASITSPPAGTVFNVYHYGAVGDGIYNDTAAIQRTIDASIGKGVAWAPPNGTHLLGAGLKFIGQWSKQTTP